jgi:Na+/proline symporter
MLTDTPGDALQALPLMILKLTPRGLLGLLFASLLAASMSTYASYLISWSSVLSQDLIGVIIKRFSGRDLKNRTQLVISRITMACLMLFIIWWSFFYRTEGLLFFYLMLAVNLFLAGTLISAACGIYLSSPRFGIIRARPLGAYLAFSLGALPTLWYFIPGHPQASLLGVWAFGLALAGMVAGSVIQNIVRPLNPVEGA